MRHLEAAVVFLLCDLLITYKPRAAYGIAVRTFDAPLNYAVVGQQKSGTSTLWMHLRAHPDIASVGERKETLWFSSDRVGSTLCDNELDVYQQAVSYSRATRNRSDLLVGDWSATYLSCLCCPVVLKTLNPDLKVIVVLRDPIQRAISRFLEQRSITFGPCHAEVVNTTFRDYVSTDLARMEGCLARAAAARRAAVDKVPGSPGTASRRMLSAGQELTLGTRVAQVQREDPVQRRQVLQPEQEQQRGREARRVTGYKEGREEGQQLRAPGAGQRVEVRERWRDQVQARLLRGSLLGSRTGGAGASTHQRSLRQEAAAAETTATDSVVSSNRHGVDGGRGASDSDSSRVGGSGEVSGSLSGGGARVVLSEGSERDGRTSLGWGAGMDLAGWMEAQCYARSNILGWSAYDIFLDNYLAHFPSSQLLVVYTEDLARQPLDVLRRVEGFLGLRPGNYSAEALGVVYNSRGCYSWTCGKNRTELRTATSSMPAAAAAATASPSMGSEAPAGSVWDEAYSSSGGGGGGITGSGAGSGGLQAELRNGGLSATIRRLAAFYRPHMVRLFALADQGSISPVPETWREKFQKRVRNPGSRAGA